MGAVSVLTGSMTVSNDQVSATSDYTFEIFISKQIPAGGKIRIGFESLATNGIGNVIGGGSAVSTGLQPNAPVSCFANYGL